MIARTLAAAALGAALSAAAPAAWSAPTPPIGDPAAFVERAYHRLEAEPTLAPPDDIYTTPRIAALKAAMVRDAHGEVPRIDFEWWTDAQDWTITDSHVRAKSVFGRPDREVVIATFKNEGRPAEIRFYFEKQRGRWLIDDIACIKAQGWTLSTLLKFGFDSGE